MNLYAWCIIAFLIVWGVIDLVTWYRERKGE